MLWAADGPYSISFSKSFLANRDNPSFDVCSLGYRCSQQALQFVFILAKPCLFLSRFDCYSEGWDGSFSESACFQGANNETLSVWRHKGKDCSSSSPSKQSASARPHALLFSIFDMQLGDPWLQPRVEVPMGSQPQHHSCRGAQRLPGKATHMQCANATRPGASGSPVPHAWCGVSPEEPAWDRHTSKFLAQQRISEQPMGTEFPLQGVGHSSSLPCPTP